MILDADTLGDDRTGPEVVIDDVEAGHLQPWMLLLADPDTSETLVVAADPEPFQKQNPAGRPERWVRIPVAGTDEQLEFLATQRVGIVFGADLDTLQPLLEEDLLTVEQEALARNGLCCEPIETDDDQPADLAADSGPVLYCGRPSDPDSYYRGCTGCDSVRRTDSDTIARRQFAGTYGPIPSPQH